MLVRLAFASRGEARARDVAHLTKWVRVGYDFNVTPEAVAESEIQCSIVAMPHSTV